MRRHDAPPVLVVALSLAGFAAGCAEDDLGDEDLAASVDSALSLAAPEVRGVLRLANDCALDAVRFDDEVGLRVDAARNIAAHRDGRDARCGTADDDPFDTLAELDAVPQVGDVALQRLLDFAVAHGYLDAPDAPAGTWEGVDFTFHEVTVVLEIANVAAVEYLDATVGLDARAARNIVAARPIAHMPALADVAYVGASALRLLKAHVAVWAPAPPPVEPGPAPEDPGPAAGTWEGVTFTAAEARTALDVANRATFGQLADGATLSALASNNIIAARPVVSMDQLAAVPWVGTVAMEKLQRYLPVWVAAGSTGDPTLTPEDKLVLFLNHPGLTVAELDAIRYIGSVQAEAIVAYLTHDRIDSLAELRTVTALETWQVESLLAAAGEWYAAGGR
ncbi:MAG: hypothetical protein GYA57_17240 [Myxococcales bacterium]|nr:hypothetical protein [Myxococcales bacterium]